MNDSHHIVFYALGVICMFVLIPLVTNDYLLAAIFLGFIVLALLLVKERVDYTVLVLGFVGVVFGEYFFVRTGVENFNRVTLLGTMPIWLPLFWSFLFLSAKRIFWIFAKDYWQGGRSK